MLSQFNVGLLYEMWPYTENKSNCLGLSMGDQLLRDYFCYIVSVSILHNDNHMDIPQR